MVTKHEVLSGREEAQEPLTLRDMTAADLARVVAIERASYSVPWTEATFRGLLRRRDSELIAADAGGRVIGYAVFWAVVDQGELGNVAVDAAWRGRGIGTRLMLEVLARARRRGVREVFLEVRPSNTVARRLYESYGFLPVGRRRNYYQEPTEDAIVLRRPVELDSR